MMQGIKEFNFTQDVFTEFDSKIKDFDDLVKVKFQVSKEVYNYFENHTFNKLELFVDGEHQATIINAQFTSSNRPYNISNDIKTGFLGELYRFYTPNEIRTLSYEQIEEVIEQNPNRFRQNDLTVHKIVQAYNQAIAYHSKRLFEFIAENELFTMWTYKGLQEYNPDLLSSRTSETFSNTPPSIHQYTKNDDILYNAFQAFEDYSSFNRGYPLKVARFFITQVAVRLASTPTGYQDIYTLGVSRYTNSIVDPSFILHNGLVIRSALYTEVAKDKDLFLKDSNYTTFLYMPLRNGNNAMVSLASLIGNDIDRDNFIDFILQDHSVTPNGSHLKRCYATKHWVISNTADVSETPNYAAPLSIYHLQYDLSRYTTKAFKDHIEGIAHQILKTKRCDVCNASRIELNGFTLESLNLPLTLHTRVSEVIKVTPYGIHNDSQIQSHDVLGEACGYCISRYERNIDKYNGYFRRGYFLSEDSVQSVGDIEYSEHLYIKDYDYTPDIYHLSDSSDDPALGIELEVDSLSDDYDDPSTNLDIDDAVNMAMLTIGRGREHVYAMHDGSLNYGFEIATYPADIHTHQDPRMFNYRPAFRNLLRAGYLGHDAGSAGLHVHLDRTFFGRTNSDQLYRASLMAYIMESNWEDFVKFSRRRYHHLEQWATKKDLKHWVDIKQTQKVYQDDELRHDFVNQYDMDKYVAFNINHRHTFELRIFRSTLKYSTYIATLQFVHNFAKLVKTIDLAKAQLITFKDIIKFEEHPELNKYVAERFGDDYLN